MRLLLIPLTLTALLLGGPTAALAEESMPTGTQVESVLPPGNSGFYSTTGQAQGLTGGSYGPHTDDQRELYWTGRYKSGLFTPPGSSPEEPRPGVRIDRDPAGVPVVRGVTDEDVWWGAGYAAGQDRLFLADAVRRYARGTYSELVGPSGLDVDTQARQATYTAAEYDAMLAALPASSQRALTSYAEGLNAWVTKVRADPRLLPAEYVLLTSLPEPWSVTDTLAAGVLITRFVASAGGDEFRVVETLRALEAKLGKTEGRKAFQDLHWFQDTKAPTTVPPADGVFPRTAARSEAKRQADFSRAADYALSLPPELGKGLSAGVPAIPGKGTQDPDGFSFSASAAAPSAAMTPAQRFSPAESLVAWAQSLHGGSYQVAVAPSRTATGGAMLESAPQLGYSYPATLWELEVHGGGYDARGVSVPGIPTVGIGYGSRTAWALTTGYSKTIDTFIETVRRTDGKLEYRHDGVWKPASCRTETLRFRQAQQGVPFGPPVQSRALEVCRTGHGPVITTSDDGTLARSLQIATWGRELETVNGILDWNRVDDLAGFAKAVEKVAWNENVMYADGDGHIAYWHPGLHPARAVGVDTRFPLRGDGSQDWTGLLPREALPHVIDPAQGYLANWNGKPAVGWEDQWHGDPIAGRASGPASRITSLTNQLAADASVTYDDLKRIDWQAGTKDHRAVDVVPVVLRLLGTTGLSSGQKAVRDLLVGWNGSGYGPAAGTSSMSLTDASVTDGPAPTAFRALAQTLVGTVLDELPPAVLARYDAVNTHVFDATPVDNLVLRVLDPASSSLTAQHDYLHGRTPQQVVRAAVDGAVAQLTGRYGADPAGWRARHPRSPVSSLTGVIGPSRTMPFLDRGSWIHLVSYPAPPRAAPRRATPGRTSPGLPATGADPLVGLIGLGLLGAAVALARSRTR